MNKILSYKCPNCGGPLKFNIEKQKYACEFCLSEFTEEKAAEMMSQEGPEDISTENTPDKSADGEPSESKEQKQEAVLYSCPSCGAQIVTDETTAASFCYYCHNPVIMEGKLSGEFLPDYVVPFAVDRTKAVAIFSEWIRKKKFVPKEFYSEEQIEKMSGVYFPYLMYSCRIKGSMDAMGNQVRVWVAGDYQYTETQTFDIHRDGDMDVKQIPRSALKKANRMLVEGVFPFQMEKLLPFTMGYLSGFLAERRDMDQEDVAPQVREEVREFAEASLKNSVGSYESLHISNHTEDLSEEKWEYALLPVWTLTYQGRTDNKMYYFTVNGQTGKVCGVLPVDKNRLAILFAAIFIPVLLFMLLLGYVI